MDRFDIAEGHYVAALDWGHYAKIERMQGYLRISPMRDTHRKLIDGGDDTREAHRVYHVQSRRYAAMGSAFDLYELRSR